MRRSLSLLGLCLALAGCGGAQDAPANDAAPVENAAAESRAQAKAELDACPFRETGDWAASVEGGRLLVTGQVDLLMAGFVPTLTVRSAPTPTIAFDLALKPEAGAAVNDRVRYTAGGAPSYRRAEIWCGGQRIESIGVVLVG